MLTAMALKSLANRRLSTALTVTSIAVAVFLLLGVEKLRTETRLSFLKTVSGTDLIVGPRNGSIQLLLYSVFRLGDASNNLSWDSYITISSHPYVDWAIPLSLGDSHRGFRVLATTNAYFQHSRHGRDVALQAAEGILDLSGFNAVLGAAAARELGYPLGHRVVIAHGTGEGSFARHDDLPFTVAGVLAPTGTPADRTVHISLQSMKAIHLGWQRGTRAEPPPSLAEALAKAGPPHELSAFLLGLKQPAHALQMQRAINAYPQEALTAILPGAALQELWSLVRVAERALLAVSALVVVTGIMGMMTTILSGLNERRREMAILRSVGARPRHLFVLLVAESTLLGAAGAIAGLSLLHLAIFASASWIRATLGLELSAGVVSFAELMLVAAVSLAALLAGLFPAWQAYRRSLNDGLTLHL